MTNSRSLDLGTSFGLCLQKAGSLGSAGIVSVVLVILRLSLIADGFHRRDYPYLRIVLYFKSLYISKAETSGASEEFCLWLLRHVLMMSKCMEYREAESELGGEKLSTLVPARPCICLNLLGKIRTETIHKQDAVPPAYSRTDHLPTNPHTCPPTYSESYTALNGRTKVIHIHTYTILALKWELKMRLVMGLGIRARYVALYGARCRVGLDMQLKMRLQMQFEQMNTRRYSDERLSG